MSNGVAQAIYAIGGTVGVSTLIWMIWAIRKTGWSPWHDDEA
jgi:hypothetical protein